MKHILYPTDFSENSEHALDYALELARLFNAEITLFNSYKIPYSKTNLLVSMIDRMREDSIKDLEGIRDKIADNPIYKNIKVNVESLSGGFVSLIPIVAKHQEIDLIVMGTKGATGLKEIFIGSNTLEVIQTAHCSVLAIPENAVKAQDRKFNTIAMATDLRPIKTKNVLSSLFDIAKQCNAPIEFVNIIQNDNESQEDRAERAIELEALAKDIHTSIQFATNDDIIDGLSEYINQKKPDLFAMLSRKHSLFERIFTKSITNKLSFRTEVPLLVMSE